MGQRVAAFITGEGNWLPVAMAIACVAVASQWTRTSGRQRVDTSMNLFMGVTLLVMGIGHLLAVSVHVADGTLRGATALLYIIGVAIVAPAAMLIRLAAGRGAVAANAWMAATLAVMGLINLPLAIPLLLSVAYRRHGNPRTGRAIAGAWLLVTIGLFAGGMLFMLSGARTFEEFSHR